MKINDEDLEGSGDFVYYHGRLFTGTAVDYHENGMPAAEVDYVNGLTHGHWKEWTVAGQPIIDSECGQGVRHGITTTYFGNGELKSRAEYEFGIETSYAEWDDQRNMLLSRMLDRNTPGANYALLLKFRSEYKA